MEQRKILLVDADNSTIDTLAIRLAIRGYDAQVAYNANMALDKLRKRNPPSVAVLNVDMLAMNGFKLLQSIKNLYPHMQIIMSSIQNDYGQLADIIFTRAYFVLKKPIDINELIHCVSVGFMQHLRNTIARRNLLRGNAFDNNNSEEDLFEIFNDIRYMNEKTAKF